MMSKKQWFVLLCIFTTYLMIGACIFWVIESREEVEKLEEDAIERQEIEELLKKHYVAYGNETQKDIFERLTAYCGKPMNDNMSSIETTRRWDYYHSLFFVMTVVSTIGYGNLAPTTTFTRLFMIFYSLIGIPMNGIVMVTLGEFFSKSFIKLYHRWKSARVKYELATVGLIGQICLYLIPGFMFFIILPSTIFMWFEGWTYDVAVYYSFVTLTTIGFGDYVAGTEDNGFGTWAYTGYQIFLFFWVILGLGFVVMILGFITSALRHKKIHEIEQKLARNIKKTPHRIREELRSILNEFLVMRVKRVYREKFSYVYTGLSRSQSCPDLNLYRNTPPMMRKRAFSECIQPQAELTRNKSDTDLERIDKERTFEATNALVEPSQLLLRVVNALGKFEATSSNSSSKHGGIDLFSEQEILASERHQSSWSLGEDKLTSMPPQPRKRAVSEVRFPFQKHLDIEDSELTWHGTSPSSLKFQNLERQMKDLQFQDSTERQGILSKVRNFFRHSRDEGRIKNVDIEKQDQSDKDAYLEQTARGRVSLFGSSKPFKTRKPSTFVPTKDQLLEETSIADFIRALASITLYEEEKASVPKRKLGTASLTPPMGGSPTRTRHLSFEPFLDSRRSSLMTFQAPPYHKRRSSLIPTSHPHQDIPRRMSLRPDPILKYQESPPRRVPLRPEPFVNFPPPPYSVSDHLGTNSNESFNSGTLEKTTGRFYVTKRGSSIGLDNSPIEKQLAKRMERKDNENISEEKK